MKLFYSSIKNCWRTRCISLLHPDSRVHINLLGRLWVSNSQVSLRISREVGVGGEVTVQLHGGRRDRGHHRRAFASSVGNLQRRRPNPRGATGARPTTTVRRRRCTRACFPIPSRSAGPTGTDADAAKEEKGETRHGRQRLNSPEFGKPSMGAQNSVSLVKGPQLRSSSLLRACRIPNSGQRPIAPQNAGGVPKSAR